MLVNKHVAALRSALAGNASDEQLRTLFSDALVANELSGDPPYRRIPHAIQGDLWLFSGPFSSRDAAEAVVRKAASEAVQLPLAIKELIEWWGKS